MKRWAWDLCPDHHQLQQKQIWICRQSQLLLGPSTGLFIASPKESLGLSLITLKNLLCLELFKSFYVKNPPTQIIRWNFKEIKMKLDQYGVLYFFFILCFSPELIIHLVFHLVWNPGAIKEFCNRGRGLSAAEETTSHSFITNFIRGDGNHRNFAIFPLEFDL